MLEKAMGQLLLFNPIQPRMPQKYDDSLITVTPISLLLLSSSISHAGPATWQVGVPRPCQLSDRRNKIEILLELLPPSIFLPNYRLYPRSICYSLLSASSLPWKKTHHVCQLKVTSHPSSMLITRDRCWICLVVLAL